MKRMELPKNPIVLLVSSRAGSSYPVAKEVAVLTITMEIGKPVDIRWTALCKTLWIKIELHAGTIYPQVANSYKGAISIAISSG